MYAGCCSGNSGYHTSYNTRNIRLSKWVIKQSTLENLPKGDYEMPDLSLSPIMRAERKSWGRISLERAAVRPPHSPSPLWGKSGNTTFLPHERVFGEARGEFQRSPPQSGKHREQVSDSDPGNPEQRQVASCLVTGEWRTVVAALKLARPLRACGSQDCQMSSWAGGGPQARMSQSQACLISRPLALFGGGSMTAGARTGGEHWAPRGWEGLRDRGLWKAPHERVSSNTPPGLENKGSPTTVSVTKIFLSPLPSSHLLPQESMAKKGAK